jgi:hypothetical protein
LHASLPPDQLNEQLTESDPNWPISTFLLAEELLILIETRTVSFTDETQQWLENSIILLHRS